MEINKEIDQEKVQVWIYSEKAGEKGRDPRFLLLLMRPDRGGFWQPVTGGVEKNEALVDAALREAGEETGFEFTMAARPIGRSFEFERRERRVRETGFVLSVEGEPTPKLDVREHVGFAWVDLASAFRLLAFRSNQEMLEALVRMEWKSPPESWTGEIAYKEAVPVSQLPTLEVEAPAPTKRKEKKSHAKKKR